MIPVAVNGLEIDASEYIVSCVARTRRRGSAKPKPSSHRIFPSRATATVIDGTPVVFRMTSMRSRVRWKSGVSIPARGGVSQAERGGEEEVALMKSSASSGSGRSRGAEGGMAVAAGAGRQGRGPLRKWQSAQGDSPWAECIAWRHGPSFIESVANAGPTSGRVPTAHASMRDRESDPAPRRARGIRS